jgi:hypothetical protein
MFGMCTWLVYSSSGGEMNSGEYTDDNNPTVRAIRAIQAEAVAKERRAQSNALFTAWEEGWRARIDFDANSDVYPRNPYQWRGSDDNAQRA